MRMVIVELLCLLLLLPGAVYSQEESTPWVALRVKQLMLVNNAPAVLLVDEPEERYLLMFISFFMANAIRMGMDGPQLERPLTHDLIGILLRQLGAKVTKIRITELKDNTYYALISVQVNGEVAEFDARPSDALAIAVRNGAPIFADHTLLKPVDASLRGEEEGAPVLPLEEEGSKGKT